MGSACNQLTKWPDNVLKILHVVFSIVALIIIHANAGIYAGSGYYALQILLILPLICAIIVLIWYIFEDPGRYKLALLIYYIIAAVFVAVVAVDYMIDLIKISNAAFKHLIAPILYLLFVVATLICYIVSAVYNQLKGIP